MSNNEQFANHQPEFGDVSNVSVVNHQSMVRSPFESCPGAKAVWEEAANQLGIKEFVGVALARSGPASAVERDILSESVPAKRVFPNPHMSTFVMSPESAIHLLKTQGGVGFRFVANHPESHAHVYECWTIMIHTDFVDACAYRDNKFAYYVGSDFAGVEQYAESVKIADAPAKEQLADVQPNVGDPFVHCGHVNSEPLHFWLCPDRPIQFVRPDRSVGQAKWIFCCDPCFHRSPGNADRLEIRGDSTWTENMPRCMKADNPYASARN